MFSKLERTIAIRYLRSKRKESFISIIAWLSLIGIALGVAILITVMAVMNGFRAELTKQILGFNGHIAVYSNAANGMHDYQKLADVIKGIPGVVSATPLVERQSMAIRGNNAVGVMVHGIKNQDLMDRKLIADNIRMGSLDLFEGNSVAIGRRLAEKFDLRPGNSLMLMTPKGTATAFGAVPKMQNFKVAAIFEVGWTQYDEGVIFMPFDTAQKFFQVNNGATAVEVFVKDPEQVDIQSNEIRSFLGPHVRMGDWRNINAAFLNALDVERVVMFCILAFIIGIAAFNILSSLVMLVKDKSQDIAIMRTMGATRGMILRIFFITGSTLGVVGTFLGVVFGLLFSMNIDTIKRGLESLMGTQLFSPVIYFLSKLPAKVEVDNVLLVISISLGISFLATIYPARRAARLDPVEAIRYE